MTQRAARRNGVLSREDLQLWAHVTRGVDPMKGRQAPTFSDVIEAAVAPMKMQTADVKSPPPAPAKPSRLMPLEGVERRLRQKLARRQREVDGVIDLHGLRQSEAHGALINFVMRAQQQGRSVVLVITGKGGDDGFAGERGVLKRNVPHWLAEPSLRRYVIGFETAARGHGGEGSLYVRIRKARA